MTHPRPSHAEQDKCSREHAHPYSDATIRKHTKRCPLWTYSSPTHKLQMQSQHLCTRNIPGQKQASRKNCEGPLKQWLPAGIISKVLQNNTPRGTPSKNITHSEQIRQHSTIQTQTLPHHASQHRRHLAISILQPQHNKKQRLRRCNIQDAANMLHTQIAFGDPSKTNFSVKWRCPR